MNRLIAALTSPFHIALLLIAVAASITFLVIDTMGWAKPDYRRLCFMMVLAYAITVVVELRPLARKAKGE